MRGTHGQQCEGQQGEGMFLCMLGTKEVLAKGLASS